MKDKKDVDSLSHMTWRYQYHAVFAPKYRRMVIYGQIKKDIGQILRQLCEQKGIETIEAEVCPDHIHMLISFPSKYSISYVMGYLKEKKYSSKAYSSHRLSQWFSLTVLNHLCHQQLLLSSSLLDLTQPKSFLCY